MTDVFAPLHRHLRLILLGVGGSWLILLLFLLAPARYRCEATLALPSVIPIEEAKPTVSISIGSVSQPIETTDANGPWKGGARTGIPPQLYEKLLRSLQDGLLLQETLGKTLEPEAIERVRRTLSDRVSPLVSSLPDGSEGEETVAAVVLSYEAYSSERSREVVSALVSLTRASLLGAIAREVIAWEAQTSERAMRSLAERKEDLLEANQSLGVLAVDLEQLTEGMPKSRGYTSREVVDTRDGGHLYLPPRLQVVGAKARQATNEHTIRTYDHALKRHAMRLKFLRRLDERVVSTETSMAPDVQAMIATELQEFVREQGADGIETRSLEADMRSLADQMAGYVTQTGFIQRPTVGTVSRANLVIALASLAALFFIVAAFVVDLWQRTTEPRAGAAAVSRAPE